MEQGTKDLLNAVGFVKEVALVEMGTCPFCRKRVDEKDFVDELSIKEFKQSGLCQKCQDDFFDK